MLIPVKLAPLVAIIRCLSYQRVAAYFGEKKRKVLGYVRQRSQFYNVENPTYLDNNASPSLPMTLLIGFSHRHQRNNV